jgi:very-short-patch-repair endonuclease
MPVFRRQHPVGPYVLDFYCAKARLAVEIDGIAHDLGDRPERDERRSVWLAAQGVGVIRIAASELTRNFDEIAAGLVQAAAAIVAGETPSTALRAVPLPGSAGEDGSLDRRLFKRTR